jgi:hypothetical protein
MRHEWDDREGRYKRDGRTEASENPESFIPES